MTQSAFKSSQSLKIIFAGTPEFAAIALNILLSESHQIISVLTQPDRRAGRGLKYAASPVKQLALQHHLNLAQPASLKDEYELEQIKNLNADVMVVAAYGLLLPVALLSIPRYGCINIHPSLLPRWRGAAPIQRTIYEGDAISGVSIMQMDQGLDTGPILLKREYVLDPEETSATLMQKLAHLGGEALIAALDLLAQDKLTATPQDSLLATYAQKITKEEALIDWQKPAIVIEREIRAFNPTPVSYTIWNDQHVRVWAAKVLAETHQTTPRTLLHASSQGIDIATGEGGVLRLLRMQLPGGKIISASDFYNARRQSLQIGEHFI